MKKIATVIFGATLCFGIFARGDAYRAKAENFGDTLRREESLSVDAEGMQIRAKSAYLMDFGTKTAIYAHNEKVRLPIASMCKIMTLLLAFEGLETGVVSLDEEITVSERAASMGGSQVFLEAHAKYPVKELIKSVVVCSANDSCVALAERLAGGEGLFVEKMNEKAKELGANDTLFANCTGLPKEPQYSCAHDVALMLKALLKHELYFDFGKVWTEKFAHPEGRYTEITNTNKLVRFYDGCDGGKTGFTNDAGFCLAATAKRGDMRIISVVIGEESSANRFEDVRTMFDYAFANYTVTPLIKAGEPLKEKAAVQGGKSEKVSVCAERTAYSFAKRGEKSNVSIQTSLKTLNAPFEKGKAAGELLIFKDGVEIERISLRTVEGVEKATVLDRWKEIGKEWNG